MCLLEVQGDKATSIAAVEFPQWSIFGPLLFVLCTADIFSNIKTCTYSAYADDTQSKCTFNSQELHVTAIISNERNANYQLSMKHNLTLNPDKSAVTVFEGAKVKRTGRV